MGKLTVIEIVAITVVTLLVIPGGDVIIDEWFAYAGTLVKSFSGTFL
jgi:hypothetical protein